MSCSMMSCEWIYDRHFMRDSRGCLGWRARLASLQAAKDTRLLVRMENTQSRLNVPHEPRCPRSTFAHTHAPTHCLAQSHAYTRKLFCAYTHKRRQEPRHALTDHTHTRKHYCACIFFLDQNLNCTAFLADSCKHSMAALLIICDVWCAFCCPCADNGQPDRNARHLVQIDASRLHRFKGDG